MNPSFFSFFLAPNCFFRFCQFFDFERPALLLRPKLLFLEQSPNTRLHSKLKGLLAIPCSSTTMDADYLSYNLGRPKARVKILKDARFIDSRIERCSWCSNYKSAFCYLEMAFPFYFSNIICVV